MNFPPGKLAFPRGIIMSMRRRSLSCLGEQLKPFFSFGNTHVPWEEGVLLLEELGPFPKENSLLPREVVFFIMEFFLLHWEFVWD
jgi:hypothetical protein